MEKVKANRTNYHSHCSFCDGRAPMEEFVKAALEQGFTAYGISSHAPLPFKTRWALEKSVVTAYLGEIARLKKKYAGQLEVYAGMEIDYLNESHYPGIAYFQELDLDYRIGSVHLVYTPDEKIVDTDTQPDCFKRILDEDFHGDLKGLVQAYFDASMCLVEGGGFDFVGHADKIAYNVACCEPALVESDWYRKRLSDFFQLIAEKGVMVEINTKAYFQKGCFFPRAEIWPMIRERSIPVVVNSDAHWPEAVNAGREEALKALKAAGFRTVCELRKGKWKEIEIG